jgi:hypothetical protein
MNTEPQITALPLEQNEVAATDAFDPQPPSYTHRGNGKIARLPKTVRDQINNWILDGVPYPEIIQRLGDQGKELNPRHFSEFRKRGHQDWLRQREWFEHVTAKSEFSKDLLAAPDSTTLHEAGLRMAAAQMIDQLMRFGAAHDDENSQPDPEQFARLVNALSRLTREALAFQKYHDACAQARLALQELKDPNRELNESETRAIVRKVNQILGLDSATCELLNPGPMSDHPAIFRLNTTSNHIPKESDCHDHREA